MPTPKHLLDWPEEYSNFDHTHPGEEAEAAVRAGTHSIDHPAWGHYGTIWFEDGKFVEEVKRYGTIVGRMTGDSLQEVFDAVNDTYGND